MPDVAPPDISPNKFSGIDVNFAQPLNVPLNIWLAGGPLIPANKFSGIEPVKPLQP